MKLRESMERITIYVFIAVSVTISVLDLLGVLENISWLANRISAVTLLLIATLSAYLISEKASSSSKLEGAIEKNVEKLQNAFSSELQRIGQPQVLRKRSEVIPMTEFAKNASSIYVIAISGYSIISPYQEFYKTKLAKGCDLKFLLLSPDSEYLEAYNELNDRNIVAREHIEPSIKMLKYIRGDGASKGKCEIRLSKFFLPFSMVGVDLDGIGGRINVEFHCYKLSLDQRPHIIIENEQNAHWFNIYKTQFELAWMGSSKYGV